MENFWNRLDLAGVLKDGFGTAIDTVAGAYAAKHGYAPTASPEEQYSEQIGPRPRPHVTNKIPTTAVEPEPVERANAGGVLVPDNDETNMKTILIVAAVAIGVAYILKKG